MTDDVARSLSKPRKIAQQARSIETTEAIVEGAARILEERGGAGFSTNAIAERAGVSIGSLYQYYPRKEAVLAALIARERAVLVEEARLASLMPTATGALSRIVGACVAHQFRRPVLARLLDGEEARRSSDGDASAVAERIEAVVLDVLARTDVAERCDARTAARDVVAMMRGMIDAAGMRLEYDATDVSRRVARAVAGYLSVAVG